MLFKLYQKIACLVAPLLVFHLKRRIKMGKEEKDRVCERWGKATQSRPEGPLIWINAASLGEVIAIVPLLHRLHQEFPKIRLLITTPTVSAANMLKRQSLPPYIHQYTPFDIPAWIELFLDYWHPQLALFVEAELLPFWIGFCNKKSIPIVLCNAQMSEQKCRRWMRLPKNIRRPLFEFELCLAQSQAIAHRLQALGAPRTLVSANLKFSTAPLPIHPEALAHLRPQVQGRIIWVAASTHKGEEAWVAQTHVDLKSFCPDLLTIIVPRHPQRRDDILKDLAGKSLTVKTRSLNEVIEQTTDVYLADTIGELGLFYHLASIAFIGGTFIKKVGGHNPIEAAQANCALLWGPYYHNFTEMYEMLRPAAEEVSTQAALAQQLKAYLNNPETVVLKGRIGREIVDSQGAVLDQTMSALTPYLRACFPGEQL